MEGLVKQHGELEMYKTRSGRFSIYINEPRGHINLHKNLTAEEAIEIWDKLIKEGWYESLDEDLFSDDATVRRVSRSVNDFIGRKSEPRSISPSVYNIMERYGKYGGYGRFRQREDLPPYFDFKIRRIE